MKFRKTAILVMATGFIFSGCAINGLNSQYADSNGTIPNKSSVQIDDMKQAISLLIKRISDLDRKITSDESTIVTLSQQLNNYRQDNDNVRQKTFGLESRVNWLEQNISERISNVEKNITAVNEQPPVSKVIKMDTAAEFKDKVVEVTARKIYLVDSPDDKAKKLKKVKKGDRFYFNRLENGFYYLSEQKAYIDSKSVVEKPARKKQEGKPTENPRVKKRQDSNSTKGSKGGQEFFADNNQKEKTATPKVANQEWVDASKAAGEVAQTLASNPNVTAENIKEQCAVTMLKNNVKLGGKQAIIDACVMKWNAIKTQVKK